MGFADIHGKAKVDPRMPQGFGVCDYGGEWRNLRDLKKQMEWTGSKLTWTGELVCDEHIDKPQAQLKAIRLPPDPLPLVNPRPEQFTTIDMPLGFTQYVMWADGLPLNFAVVLTTGTGQPILTDTGQEILIEIGHDGIALLAQLTQMTGIPVPGDISVYSGTITKAQVSQPMLPAGGAGRTYIAIFNPCTAPIAVNLTSPAMIGVAPSLNIGAGGCLFWATAQNFGPPTQLAINVVGEFAGVPFYVYANG